MSLVTKEMAEQKKNMAAQKNGDGLLAGTVEQIVEADGEAIAARSESNAIKRVRDSEKAYSEARSLMLKAHSEMLNKLAEIGKTSKEAISKSKDLAQQMADSMNKITKVIGPDFEKRLEQLQQFTDCMERLSALQSAGKLGPMIEALSQERKQK